MNRRIILCGGNGSGKSTLGKALADAMGIKFMDNEDYNFPKRESDYKYDHALTREEFMPILQNDMEQEKDWIFASVKGNYGELYEREQKFFDMVKNRTNEVVEKWVSNLSCPVIRVDGTKPVKENVELLVTALPKE